jgi:hypothetical protein
MYNAPSVAYPVGRCAFQRWLLLGFSMFTSALLFTWVWHQGLTLAWYVALSSALIGGYQGFQALRQSAMLTWDGQFWCLHNPGLAVEDALGDVEVVLDVQKALLLRWLPTSDTLQAQSNWLWLGTLKADNPVWLDIRRAVYQHVH